MRTIDGEALEVRQCLVCGKGMASYGPEDATCALCQVELSSRQEPESLQDMRHVYQGRPPSSPAQTMLKGLWERSPAVFMAQLRQAEKEWRERVDRVIAGKPAAEPTGPDEGSDRVEELIERLLKEASS